VEDIERNDGSPEKPYYMSDSLKKILKKQNRGSVERVDGASD
jgi:choline transporter-like protein 2/4/5